MPRDDIGPARDWVRVLARYRAPSASRSILELVVTFVPFVSLMAAAFRASHISPALTLVVSILNAGFLVRLFIIQHDCSHGSLFVNRHANDWIGRALGVLTLTPYDVWRRTHSIHHASSGNLDRRGIGDMPTLTVAEYLGRSTARRFFYRLMRQPLVMFGILPAYLFLLQNRLPIGLMRSGSRYWISAMLTNAGTAAAIGAAIWYLGGVPTVLVILPTILVAAAIGVWLFYVQHQFAETVWDRMTAWDLHEAALHGSSHYVLPPILRWFSGNIGIHHIHHLYSRIPFYRLPEVLLDHPALEKVQRLTLRESLRCARLHLWDEQQRRLVAFSEAHPGTGTRP
ncbi:MAG: fatty acid desaturase [Paracoccaceae bacterium]|nr:fatty acid desaturase [Paracoccaceae bacterium]